MRLRTSTLQVRGHHPAPLFQYMGKMTVTPGLSADQTVPGQSA